MAPSDEHDDERSRWQLPLRPLDKPLSGPGTPEKAKPVLPPITLRRDDRQVAPPPPPDRPAPAPQPDRKQADRKPGDRRQADRPQPDRPQADRPQPDRPAPAPQPDRTPGDRTPADRTPGDRTPADRTAADDDDGAPHPREHRPMESPDITARFVVAQLAELNERLGSLTEATAERTADALEEVRAQLARLTSLREHDLTEQAAGIFAAVDTGTEAIDRFSSVVSEVTTDLRLILGETLEAIGGIDGLGEAVVQGATDFAETRSELTAGIARIQRDLATLRKRIPVQSKTPPSAPVAPPSVELSDEQVAYIVEAVTEAVVAALNPARPPRRRPGA